MMPARAAGHATRANIQLRATIEQRSRYGLHCRIRESFQRNIEPPHEFQVITHTGIE